VMFCKADSCADRFIYSRGSSSAVREEER